MGKGKKNRVCQISSKTHSAFSAASLALASAAFSSGVFAASSAFALLLFSHNHQ
ncbi:hypothetical protein RCO48_09025 [Peribacillus frigoritolerans]|nr:hypothetical protein [Peribacillus frigoritolerans]